MSGSAGGPSVMREFLISLGFQVNRSSANEFRDTVADMTQRIESFATAIQRAAADIVIFTTKMSDQLERLYYSAQRIGGGADAIKAFGYAASQMGSSVQDASQSLEALTTRIRNNPGYGSMVQGLLGGKADLSNRVATMTQLGEAFKGMERSVAVAYAQSLGISDSLLDAMMRGLGQYSAEYQAKMKAFGVDNDKAADSGKRFMQSMRSLQGTIEIVYTRIGAGLADRLRPMIDKFDAFMVKNADVIKEYSDKFVKFVGNIGDALTHLITRFGDAVIAILKWFNSLDPALQKLVEVFGILLIAWKTLNFAFLASPIGIVLALAAAIFLLWDDYNTWKTKGGANSLIDWSKWEPSILKAKEWMVWIGDKLTALTKYVGVWQAAFGLLGIYLAGSWASGAIVAIGRIGLAMAPLLAAIAVVAGIRDIWQRGITGNIPGGTAETDELRQGGQLGDHPTGERTSNATPGGGFRGFISNNMPRLLGGGSVAAETGRTYGLNSALGINDAQYGAFREGVADIEGSRYNQMGGSSNRFAGRYQMGADEIRETAQRLGEPTPSQTDFLANPGMQERYFEAYTQGHHQELMQRSPIYAASDSQTRLQILAYAHNQGVGGALNWLNRGVDGRDAFGTSGSRFSQSVRARQQALGGGAAAAPRSATGGSMVPSGDNFGGPNAGAMDALRQRGLTGGDQGPALGATPAGGGTVSQVNNINVTGSTDPQRTADLVALEVTRVGTGALSRNLGGGAR